MKVYADNAATMRMREKAYLAMIPFLRDNYGNPSSTHEYGIKAAQSLSEARKKIAKCLNCLDSEIYFTSGGTESNNQALYAAVEWGLKSGKKHIISTAIEHSSVLNTLKRLEKHGFEITLLGVNNKGLISIEDLIRAIKPETCLVSIMSANNEIGTIQPIKEIGVICRERGIIFHTDAVQAVGHISINVERDKIDMLSASAHKFGGAKGTGFIFVRKGLAVAPLLCGGGQERGLRSGTENVPGVIAMAVAFEESCLKMQSEREYEMWLRNHLIDKLLKIPNSFLNGEEINRLPNNINMRFEGAEGETLVAMLSQKGIMVSAGSACSSGTDKASHVLKAIGLTETQARSSIRMTLSAENTLKEIDYLISSVKESVNYLRAIS